MTTAPLLAVTMGDPSGIGIEISAKAWQRREVDHLAPFFLIGGKDEVTAQINRLFPEVPVEVIPEPAASREIFARALPLLALEDGLDPAEQTIEAIRLGVELCQSGDASALVTNPIHKRRLYEAGFTHPGHTEYLAALTGEDGKSVMMLACTALKVVPATVHIPIAKVPEALDAARLSHVIETTHRDLTRRFGLASPRLVVAGLNPHAGEDGTIGREEETVIRPVIAKLQADGMKISGPFPADSLFHPAARQNYDAAICMYHDQALIPIKTIDFDGGVNVTLGLSIIRTSPDHGTAEDIAGKGLASPLSLIAAIKLAAEMADATHG
ncbi:4-hydroxythreonine-4-phosphate dehydrogenase PdxA [uncultured Sneathiella sp.]|jgi:4-hydroxythreonine-4-phosphate dehydrogenase|uniref:4-hydroxythreonine-4-phosphate dehydrogenase PdxA n=1 Tax=uncultured Sneathiella sp. TaxID=879315 RepID=UPI0030DC3BD8